MLRSSVVCPFKIAYSGCISAVFSSWFYGMKYTQPELVLASGSPRRRELLAYLGLLYQVAANDAEERAFDPPPALAAQIPPLAVPWHLHPVLRAWRKAAACEGAPDGVIIAADTIVVIDGIVLNKPVDTTEARKMLRQLAGREHFVYTGMALIDGREQQATRFAIERSTVTIAALHDDAIAAYVATGEPLDKAGAYGIQGIGGTLVRAVEGSYTNVVGLPLTPIYNLLAERGFAGMTAPTEAYHRWLVAQGKEPMPCPSTSP